MGVDASQHSKSSSDIDIPDSPFQGVSSHLDPVTAVIHKVLDNHWGETGLWGKDEGVLVHFEVHSSLDWDEAESRVSFELFGLVIDFELMDAVTSIQDVEKLIIWAGDSHVNDIDGLVFIASKVLFLFCYSIWVPFIGFVWLVRVPHSYRLGRYRDQDPRQRRTWSLEIGEHVRCHPSVRNLNNN